MQKLLVSVFGLILSLGLSTNLPAQFTAFNDFYRGTETHANATDWNAFATASGLLKDINSGLNTTVTLTSTNNGAAQAATAGKPNTGTPAYNVFNTPVNYIDWTNSANNVVQLTGNSSMGNVLSGLDPNKRYRLTVTGVRGSSTYTDRWTTYDLVGADSFTPAHSAGCLTNGSAGVPTTDITPSQCVINTGYNLAGAIAVWDNIEPGPDGTVAVVCWTYKGTVPNGGTSGGVYGYGVHALKLEEWVPVPTPVSIVGQPQDQNVIENQPATFRAVAAGTPPPTFQWYVNDDPIPNATNSSYTVSNATLNMNGNQYYVVAQNTVNNIGYTAQSSTANLTVTPDVTAPFLVGAFSSTKLTNVTVTLSEPVLELTATNLANYLITNAATGAPLSISRATVNNLTNVILNTSLQVNGATYIVVVNGVTDRAAAANQIAPNSTISYIAQANFYMGNLGNPSPSGSLTNVPNGVDITGGGVDIGGTSDSCQYAYQTRTGDFDVRVRVAGFGPADVWAKAALMARPSGLSASGVFAATVATPGLSGCFLETRTVNGGTAVTSGSYPINYPYTWLRLQRTNLTTFNSYVSGDGVSWFFLGTTTIAMADPVAIGLGLSSHINGTAVTAQFRDFGEAVNPATATYWSMPNEPLGPTSRKTSLAITEIMYKPAPRTDALSLEFVEIYNSNPFFENLSGYRLSGDVDFNFPSNTILQGNSFLVIAKDPTAMRDVYGLTNVMGPYTNTLKVPGTVRLRDEQDRIMQEVNYSADPPWPAGAQGTGHSLALARPSYGQDNPQAWGLSGQLGGSPGGPDGAYITPLSSVLINEFLANTRNDTNLADYIELYNHSSQPVEITGCMLSDDPLTNKFVIPSNTIPAQGFVVFYRNELGFGLENAGETICFKTPANRPVDRRVAGFAGFITIPPVVGQAVIAARIPQLQAAPPSIGPFAPAPSSAIRYFVNDVMVGDNDQWRDAVGLVLRHSHGEAFAVAGQFPRKGPESIARIQGC